MSAYRYLLDTNIVSDLLRQPKGATYQRIAEVGWETVCTSAIVLCELRYGVRKRGARKLSVQLQTILDTLPSLSFDPLIDRHYADVRVELESLGTPIGPNDYFIAAHALSLGLTLVTHNIREFGRVPGLRVEDWLA